MGPFWSSSILVVFHFGRLPFWSSSILVVFHFGRLPFWSSSFFGLGRLCFLGQVVFTFWVRLSSLFGSGCLPFGSSSIWVVFHFGRLPFRSSFIWLVFHLHRLPFGSS